MGRKCRTCQPFQFGSPTTGYTNTHVLPLLIDFSKQYGTNATISRPDKNGHKNLIFVGKVAPHKSQDELIKVFYYYNKYIEPNSTLHLVGSSNGFENYRDYLKNLNTQLKLNNVNMTGAVSQEELIDYYQKADAFICMSQHEGFCVPLIESMYFNIPILALNTTAVPWTLNNSSIVFDTNDYLEIAELINHVLSDKPLRNRIVANQSKRLKSFELKATSEKLRELIRSAI